MTAPSIGFIGAGRVATILLGGWSRAGRLPSKIVASDVDSGVLDRLRGRHPEVRCTAAGDPAPAQQDVVFLALHPPAFGEALPVVRGSLRPDALVVSLAPKITNARLAEMLGGYRRIARVIPNAPSIVGAGFNPVAFAPDLKPDERAPLLALLKPLGECPVVDEAQLEAYALLSGMGPTYLWPQFVELEALGVQFGLSPSQARQALRAMVIGAVDTLCRSGLDAPAVQDLIPVKPLADAMPGLLDTYRTKLTGLLEKIRPQ